jgi:hypothetical protein
MILGDDTLDPETIRDSADGGDGVVSRLLQPERVLRAARKFFYLDSP